MNIVGRYFHSFYPNGNVDWKGQILSIQENESYVVQLFNWTDGKSNCQKIVKRENMTNWIFSFERF